MNSKTTNTHLVELREYKNPEARNLLETIKQKITDQAKESGKRDAESNLPGKKDHLLLYVGHILSLIQQLLFDLKNLHKPDEDLSLALEEKQRLLEQSRNERDEQQARYNKQEKAYHDHKNVFPSTLAIVVATIVLLLGLMEGMLSLGAIRAFIPNYFFALFAALIYGLSLTILAHQIAVWWNIGRTKMMRWLIRFTIVTGISLVFYLMGILRSGQMNMALVSLEDSGTVTLFTAAKPEEALMFMCIAWLAFLPAVLLAKYAPSKAEWMAIFKARSLKKELRQTGRSLKSILEQITQTQQSIENLKQYGISRNQAAIREEEIALSLVEHVRAVYVQHNVRYRLDKGDLPKCLHEKLHYPLTTYFQNTQNAQKR